MNFLDVSDMFLLFALIPGFRENTIHDSTPLSPPRVLNLETPFYTTRSSIYEEFPAPLGPRVLKLIGGARLKM